MEFKKRITTITDQSLKHTITGRFGNEVYLSTASSFGPIEYTATNFSVKYLYQGNKKYIINGRKCNLGSRNLLIVSEGQKLLGEHNDDANHIGLSIFLDRKTLVDVINPYWQRKQDILPANESSNQLPPFYDYKIYQDSNASKQFSQLVESFLVDSAIELDEADYYEMAELLLKLNCDIFNKISNVPRANQSTRVEIYRRLCIAKEILDDSNGNRFDLESLSKESAMSKYLLIRCFKAVYGITPQKYYQTKMVMHAKHFLASGFSVTETSEKLKFPDVHSFSKQFKKITGEMPKVYRRKKFGGFEASS